MNKNVGQRIVELIDAKTAGPVTLRLKNGGAIFNALLKGVSMKGFQMMTVQYLDMSSGDTHSVRSVGITDIAEIVESQTPTLPPPQNAPIASSQCNSSIQSGASFSCASVKWPRLS